MKNTFDWDEVNALITILHAQGISYLMGSDEPVGANDGNVEPVHLIQRLAG